MNRERYVADEEAGNVAELGKMLQIRGFARQLKGSDGEILGNLLGLEFPLPGSSKWVGGIPAASSGSDVGVAELIRRKGGV